MRNESRTRKILPVDLLLEGRACLVVGGGPIAARKVGSLLEAGAVVTVVSPVLCSALAELKQEGRIRHKPRAFTAVDIKSQAVVFAVTDNGLVNRKVIRSCRRARILCSAADAHWVEGDFVSPAVIRRPLVTVAISTGGQSCKRAREIKEKLVQYLDGQKL